MEIWLYEKPDMRIEGIIVVHSPSYLYNALQGFDEYMNTVLDDAEEVY